MPEHRHIHHLAVQDVWRKKLDSGDERMPAVSLNVT